MKTMKQLLLIRAPGLGADQAVRGDVAWNLSDLIADGSFAKLSGPVDAAAATAGLPAGSVRVVEIPYAGPAEFDVALGRAREESVGALLAIVSDEVFVCQHWFREIKPGTTLTPGELPALLASMLG
jgi:hypothetical protein